MAEFRLHRGIREKPPQLPLNLTFFHTPWVLPSLIYAWIIVITKLYLALNMTPVIDCK